MEHLEALELDSVLSTVLLTRLLAPCVSARGREPSHPVYSKNDSECVSGLRSHSKDAEQGYEARRSEALRGPRSVRIQHREDL